MNTKSNSWLTDYISVINKELQEFIEASSKTVTKNGRINYPYIAGAQQVVISVLLHEIGHSLIRADADERTVRGELDRVIKIFISKQEDT